MVQNRLNCWEFLKCGREPGGEKANKLGICPAADDVSFDGINSGKNGGRICWAVAGTFCDGNIQGTFAEKRDSCLSCSFYKTVQEEEKTTNRHTKFLRFISQDDRNPVFDKMAYKHIKKGERFVCQGEAEDTAYIIQRGSCLVVVEKDAILHPVDHYGEGDIVGGLGILTGEPRRAHVEAETDLELWVLKRENFEDISTKDPELLTFLTEIVADRLDSRRPTAYRTIGKYVTTDIIGRGAFSIVYKGIHKGLNMPVAIKMMRHDMATNDEFLDSFHREAKTIASLNHDNIIRVYDIEERYRTVFIIEELVDGISLEGLLERLKTIPPPAAVHYLIQICSGLDYAHQRDIIHRDINTTNIFVRRDDRIKILDFGLACPIGTEDMTSFGTAFYMAPEQIRSEPLDQRTDIYALGITAFEMVTGKKPFQVEDLRRLFEMHLNHDIPNTGDVMPNLPDGLRGFIRKACSRDPLKRYQTAGQALSALQTIAKDFSLTQKYLPPEQRKMSTVFLMYRDEHQLELNRLMEEFSIKARKLGVELKVADFRDL
ncbi:MAG: protein kinase [Deltaproteobacteria bacterium]|nr:protein kinase [Deltaproteobacteria bacterium]